jgi:hypothetical protein
MAYTWGDENHPIYSLLHKWNKNRISFSLKYMAILAHHSNAGIATAQAT